MNNDNVYIIYSITEAC